jgi:hypothetical protein
MKIDIDINSVLKVVIYLSLFFLIAFLGAMFWPDGITESKQPVEIKHSPGYSDSSLYDYYQIQEHIDKYIESLEKRIQELEGNSPPFEPNPNLFPDKSDKTLKVPDFGE